MPYARGVMRGIPAGVCDQCDWARIPRPYEDIAIKALRNPSGRLRATSIA